MFDDFGWMAFREDCFRQAKARDEHVLKTWCEEFGYHQPMGYYNRLWDNQMTIFTTDFDVVIGKKARLEELLNHEFKRSYTVHFIAVGGGFTNIHQDAKCRDERVLANWCKDVDYKYPFGYFNHFADKTMKIFTNHPGVVIGKNGRSINWLETLLTREFDCPYKVELVEIQGDFININ